MRNELAKIFEELPRLIYWKLNLKLISCIMFTRKLHKLKWTRESLPTAWGFKQYKILIFILLRLLHQIFLCHIGVNSKNHVDLPQQALGNLEWLSHFLHLKVGHIIIIQNFLLNRISEIFSVGSKLHPFECKR